MNTSVSKLSAIQALQLGRGLNSNGEPTLKPLVPEIDGECDLLDFYAWWKVVAARVYGVSQ